MAASQPHKAAVELRLLASDLNDLADRYEIQSMTMGRVDRLVDDVEQIAEDVRAVVRGRRR